MKSIEEYILLSKNMPNTSDGGSAAYHFDDVVLVEYTNLNKYGLARDNEELISIAANNKRYKGVNTPYHLAFKRIVEGEKNYCCVLQERAKGVCFDRYTSYKNSPDEQIIKQLELFNLPQSIYDKLVSDLYELINMGIELKPKNIYFDKEYGFTIIDLLGYNSTPVNENSLLDIMTLKRLTEAIFNFTVIDSYTKGANTELVNKSKELNYGIKKKIYLALKKKIINFDKINRFILRTYSKEELEYFNNNNIKVEDLSFTDKEHKDFDDIINYIIYNYINKIGKRELSYYDVIVNEIRNLISQMGLKDNFKYHKDYPKLNREDYEDDWDYKDALNNYLNNMIYDKFDKRLEELSNTTDNEYIIGAYKESCKKRSRVLK